ncbi:acyltransferase family protein [Streptomyces sp. NBC_00820]|uniref:acyltransferase family protein n=1 Tax=Streptomyces sp. NBC_00820 TaxID=2975842 RepID=UPI002ECFD40E
MSRDRYVDFLRAWAIASVVVGHWLITALVRRPDGTIAAPELLASLPWTQWLTLGFQIMPLFFLAGGHAAGGSWARARARARAVGGSPRWSGAPSAPAVDAGRHLLRPRSRCRSGTSSAPPSPPLHAPAPTCRRARREPPEGFLSRRACAQGR